MRIVAGKKTESLVKKLLRILREKEDHPAGIDQQRVEKLIEGGSFIRCK